MPIKHMPITYGTAEREGAKNKAGNKDDVE
jgi:hypothetical protein